jgi:hypothetical protein
MNVSIRCSKLRALPPQLLMTKSKRRAHVGAAVAVGGAENVERRRTSSLRAKSEA